MGPRAPVSFAFVSNTAHVCKSGDAFARIVGLNQRSTRAQHSAVAEMGDRFARIDTGRKVGAAVPLSMGELGP